MDYVTTPAERFEDIPNFDYPHQRVPVTDDGAEMSYVDVEGDGDETFLLAHGEPTWSFLYRKLIPTLSEHGRVIAPDLIGLGRSDKYTDPEDYDFELVYDSFRTLIVDELDLDEVTLVCQDWGGLIGLTLAAHEADRFARLVPMNTGLVDGTQEMPEEWHQFANFVADVDELPIGMLLQGATATELSDEVIAAYEAPFHTEESKACARALPAMVPQSPDDDGAEMIGAARERLSDWQKPAFVLYADSDPITTPARADMHSLLPTADEQPDVWIEGAMHFLQEDAGEEIAEEVVKFVKRTR